MMADKLLNAQDLITAKKHDTFRSEVITGKAGGLSTGADIDYATNAVTGQVQKTLPKILDDIDWSYVGLFADGVTFTDKTDFAVDAVGTQWIYTGSLPFSATAGTVPSEPAYQVVHVKSASAISNANGGSVQDFIDAQTINAGLYLTVSATPRDAVVAAIAAAGSRPVFIPNIAGVVWNLTNVQLNNDQTVLGDDTTITLTSNVGAFFHGKRSKLRGFRFVGSGKDSGFTNQNAVSVLSSVSNGNEKTRTLTESCHFKDLGGSAWLVKTAINDHEGNKLTDYFIESCNIGVNIDDRGEYCSWGNGGISLCNIGARIKGGNSQAVGAVISDNAVGVELVNGLNDSHGSIVGALINHNTTPIKAGILSAESFLFDSCMIYYGNIELTGTKGLKIKNSDLSNVNIYEDGCTNCWFIGNDMIENVVNYPNHNGNASEVFYLDNIERGASNTGNKALGGGYLRLTQNANISTVPTGESYLDWNNVASNAINRNSAYTVQQFYAAGTANPFIRGDVRSVRKSGPLQVQSFVTFGKSGSVAWNASEVTVLMKNASGNIIGYYTPVTQQSVGAANTITYQYFGPTPRNSFKVVIQNNSGGLITLYRDQPTTQILTNMTVTGW